MTKVKRDIMINNYPDGSLKMIDIHSLNKALKATGLKKPWTLKIRESGHFSLTLNLRSLATIWLHPE